MNVNLRIVVGSTCVGSSISAMDVEKETSSPNKETNGDDDDDDDEFETPRKEDDDANLYYESKEFYDHLKNAARKALAEERLMEWKAEKQTKGEDYSFIDNFLADLDEFVRDNQKELDELLAQEESKPPSNNQRKKRGLDLDNKDEEELDDSDTAAPPEKKSMSFSIF